MFFGSCFGGCGGWAVGAFVLGLLVNRNRSNNRGCCEERRCCRCCRCCRDFDDCPMRVFHGRI